MPKRRWALGLLVGVALGVASSVAAQTTPTCVPDATTLCLNGRFGVNLTWVPPEDRARPANAVPITDATGYFWFFDASNVEFVVKVLDGCAITETWWVFGTPLTSLGWTLQVTDTVTGDSLCWGCGGIGLPPPTIVLTTDVFPRACP